jgi:hypothetical protein
MLAAPAASPGGDRLAVPVHRVVDSRVRSADRLDRFWRSIWPEAARTFGRGGIDLHTTDSPGEVRRTAADRPLLVGLRAGAVNLVLTDHIPMFWDRGRASAGTTTIHQGRHVCMIALAYAHGHRIPFVSVNTCVHELLHALLQDVFVARPEWYDGGGREARVEWHATALWLFGAGAAVRASGREYLERLRLSTISGIADKIH